MSKESKKDELIKNVEELVNKIQILNQDIQIYQKRNQFFEMLILSLPGLFYLFDSYYRPYKWNTNVETVLGYSAKEICTLKAEKLFQGNDLIKVKESVKKAFTEGRGSVEVEIKTKEGIFIPYFFTGICAQIAGTLYLVGIGLDMSHKKKAEDNLKENEALYNIFTERMAEGVLFFRKRKVLFTNNVFSSICGYTDSKQLLDTDVMELIADDYKVYFLEMYEALENGICSERFFQARWTRKDHREIWIEGRANRLSWQGRPTVLLWIRDITENKKKEISMQEETAYLRRENVNLRSSIKDRYRFRNIIGKSSAMQEVYELILNAAATSANVVIYGESGTGKELVARAVHEISRRSNKEFVTVNSAAIPDNLLESEFFGHKKGAFTGAFKDKKGYLDIADGGTLFLDEIGELSVNLQAKLLRSIEAGGYNPVGGVLNKHSDFRIISATNRNLIELCREGKMREDFFYRIHIIPIEIPPLRKRKEDLPLLLDYFLSVYSGQSISILPGYVMEAFITYDWPGNVRELQNVIQRYLAVKNIDFLNLPSEQKDVEKSTKNIDKNFNHNLDLQTNLNDFEKTIIIDALKRCNGKKNIAADKLKISRKTLFRKIKKLDINT